MKKWIWQQDGYPHFSYDFEKLNPLAEQISQKLGYLSAMSELVSKESIVQNQMEALENEAINTSAIEGEILNRSSVKSSVNKKFGFHHKQTDPSTQNLIDLIVDTHTNYDKPLTLQRLFAWHNGLFVNSASGIYPINVASFRGDETMQIVSGFAGHETIYYEAPPRERLEDEMYAFLQWFNETKPSIIKAAIAHLWFVIIHPFDDGNGRIARALSDMVLSNVEKSNSLKLYSISTAINDDRKRYYNALEHTTGYVVKSDKHLDVTYWCEWFLKTILNALDDAQSKLKHITQKTAFWDKHKNDKLNARQIKVLNFILDIGVDNFKGYLSTKKYTKIADTTTPTASRDIAELVRLSCIRQVENSAGRNVRYVIVV
ncbi:Fic family protein [Sulfurimonas hydrogeniphila]|uniref:Fic family protein n=1 Tax=Sulfurimonas hydrogeniphila TaxID=2509341 RepID=UPI00125ECC51|nr:Fic family protein [Sulfurimonas hydrogeniphila]